MAVKRAPNFSRNALDSFSRSSKIVCSKVSLFQKSFQKFFESFHQIFFCVLQSSTFLFFREEDICSRGKRRHRVPRLATSQLIGFILGYHSGRLRVLLVASPLQTRVLVQSVVLPLRQHFGLRRHWLKCGDTATPWRRRNPTAYRLAAK